MSYFTLPVGYDPQKAFIKHITDTEELMLPVLQTEDISGPYILYQRFDGCDAIPMCRVRKPLIVGKPLIYLDTSVVSYIDQPDTPEREAVTLKFWDAARAGAFDLVLSDVTLDEVKNCPEPKRSSMLTFLRTFTCKSVISEGNTEITTIIDAINKQGILPKRCVEDTRHIAVAVYEGCDVLASWNFKHLVNTATVTGIRTVSLNKGFSMIDLLTPEQIMEVHYGL